MRNILLLFLLISASLFANDLDFKYKFGARVDLDASYYNLAEEDYTDSEVRRARISTEGSLFDKQLRIRFSWRCWI